MKKIFTLIIFSLFAISAFSQVNITSFQYSMGFGTGSMHDYISAPSFRGFTFDYRKEVKSNIGVGVDLGWNVFYDEMPNADYEYQNVTYSGKQWRYSNHFPMLLGVDYFKITEGRIHPYGGFALGTMYSLQNTDMGTWTFEKDAWHFAIRPELGILIETAPGAGFNIVGKYYYGLAAGDLPAQGYFTLNFGFVFTQ